MADQRVNQLMIKYVLAEGADSIRGRRMLNKFLIRNRKFVYLNVSAFMGWKADEFEDAVNEAMLCVGVALRDYEVGRGQASFMTFWGWRIRGALSRWGRYKWGLFPVKSRAVGFKAVGFELEFSEGKGKRERDLGPENRGVPNWGDVGDLRDYLNGLVKSLGAEGLEAQKLSKKELCVLVALYGEVERPFLGAVGSRLGVTKERVRQLESEGLKKLRSFLREKGFERGDIKGKVNSRK